MSRYQRDIDYVKETQRKPDRGISALDLLATKTGSLHFILTAFTWQFYAEFTSIYKAVLRLIYQHLQGTTVRKKGINIKLYPARPNFNNPSCDSLSHPLSPR